MKANICAVQRVELPGWCDDVPFTATLRRPSLLTMAAQGAIPNELMGAAQKLFGEGFDAVMPLDSLGRLLRAIAKDALVEPTLEELEAQDAYLTDMQLAAIYTFAQSGVRALEPFRQRSGDNIAAGDEQEVLGAAQRSAENR